MSFYAPHFSSFFFFNDTATTEIYTLSLHDALPICGDLEAIAVDGVADDHEVSPFLIADLPDSCREDRKSTRLNSSHSQISYAVFCLKKKKKQKKNRVFNIIHHTICITSDNTYLLSH